MVWLDPELAWQAAPSGRASRPAVYSDAAIKFCLTLKCMFGLGLRQATGLAESFLKLAKLVQVALHCFGAIYKESFNFAKAGIHLLELEPARVEQKELLLDESPHGRDELMSAMDRINARYGHGSLYLASAGTAGAWREWTMWCGLKTPEYTTLSGDT